MIKPTLSDIVIELHIDDFAKAKEFYGILGFSPVWEKKPHVNKDGYLIMKMGNSYLCFNGGSENVYNHPYFKKYPRHTKRGYGVEIAIPTMRIKELYAKIFEILKSNILEPLSYKEYKKWEFRLEDPFGYYLRFTDPVDINYEE